VSPGSLPSTITVVMLEAGSEKVLLNKLTAPAV
jgi:hypothetical protein